MQPSISSDPVVLPITIVGSCFLDTILYTDRLPREGETVHSHCFERDFGGKGANQAVIAAKLGSHPVLLTVVGTDHEGAVYLEQLRACGVNTNHIKALPGGGTGSKGSSSATGAAFITVDAQGHNTIVISPNVIQHFTIAHLPNSVDWLSGTNTVSPSPDACFPYQGILLCQNEIPLETTLHALQTAASQLHMFTILNPSPAPETAEQSARILADGIPYVSLFCLNQHETSRFCDGFVITDVASSLEAISMLRRKIDLARRCLERPLILVLTLGALGAVYSTEAGEVEHVPALALPTESVVDTTGAGDAFVGALAHFLAAKESIKDAITHAVSVAGYTVQRKGTQKSYPTREELGLVPTSHFAGRNNSTT